MADELDRVFEHIVRAYAITDNYVDVDLLADAAEDGTAIDAEKQQAANLERQKASVMRDAFRDGLVAAYRLEQNDGGELRLSDQDPKENQMADALIRYLVSFGFAASHSKEVAPMQYDYYFSVKWDNLGKVAQEVGVDLTQVLASAA